MILGVPPGSNVYSLTTIMAVVIWALYLVYLAARPFLEARAKCWKCPEEEPVISNNTIVSTTKIDMGP